MNKPITETQDKKDQIQSGVGLQVEDNESQRERFVYNKLTEDPKQTYACVYLCARRSVCLCGQRYLKGARAAVGDVLGRSH